MMNNSNTISIDIGYGDTKVFYKNKLVKFPTAISYSNSLDIEYGRDNVYEFENEKYYVGADAVDSESFSMNDYNLLHKFAPLIIYHVLKKFDEHRVNKPIYLNTGLSISDWGKKTQFSNRIIDGLKKLNSEVDAPNIHLSIIPQGAGIYMDYVNSHNNPNSATVIDIGSNTINLIHFKNGKPIKKFLRGFPNHGVSSISKTLSNYLEQKYGVAFSSTESNEILVNERFLWNGVNDDATIDYIKTLKFQFVQKLFRSVLVNEKKLLSTSEVVIIGGGGAYFFENIEFPPNVTFIETPYEYGNVRGYFYSTFQSR